MIAIISDIHGNLPALNAVLYAIDELGCQKIISLGDITGYYSHPHECVDKLRHRNALQLLGNHDYYIVSGTACPRSTLVSDLIKYQRKVITEEQKALFSTFSSQLNIGDMSMVHGGWNDPLDEYLYEVSEHDLVGNNKYFFSGHTHVQTLFLFQDKIYCNPGSVGQPRDGDPRAAFAIFDGGRVVLHRVEYDIDETVKLMKSVGFTDRKLWDNLYVGSQIGGRIDKVIIRIT